MTAGGEFTGRFQFGMLLGRWLLHLAHGFPEGERLADDVGRVRKLGVAGDHGKASVDVVKLAANNCEMVSELTNFVESSCPCP